MRAPPSIRPRSDPRRAGFTLVEVMAGTMLLGMLMFGVYAVAVGTVKAKRKIDEMSAVYTAGPRILDLIEKDLRSAYAFEIKDGIAFKAQRQSLAGGDAVILDLVTTTNSKTFMEIDDRIVRSDVTEIGYRMRRNDDYSSLLELYRREQFFFDDDLIRGGDYHLVYDGIRSLKVDFFEPPEEGTSNRSEEEGLEDWDSADKGGLPHAARITLELAPPKEATADLDADERRFMFVRWVLFPTAYDKQPDQDQGPTDGAPQTPR